MKKSCVRGGPAQLGVLQSPQKKSSGCACGSPVGEGSGELTCARGSGELTCAALHDIHARVRIQCMRMQTSRELTHLKVLKVKAAASSFISSSADVGKAMMPPKSVR